MEDRRKYPRIVTSLPVKLADSDYDILTETKNVSASGVYCCINKPIEPMTKLNIVLLVPIKKNTKKDVKKINCQGVVVRNIYVKDNGNSAYHIGIFFNDITDRDKKTLSSYLHPLRSEKKSRKK
ncbi:MAG: PilZ domain-containing protein [Candidatus Omnitrophica bacterium]|nr:PilZ domain-containing protein [Candidatus Omnitrophota bacterium]